MSIARSHFTVTGGGLSSDDRLSVDIGRDEVAILGLGEVILDLFRQEARSPQKKGENKGKCSKGRIGTTLPQRLNPHKKKGEKYIN